MEALQNLNHIDQLAMATRSGNPAAGNQLWSIMRRYCAGAARQARAMGVPREDAEQFIGLAVAIALHSWDPAQGHFAPWGYWKLRGELSVFRGCKEVDTVPLEDWDQGDTVPLEDWDQGDTVPLEDWDQGDSDASLVTGDVAVDWSPERVGAVMRGLPDDLAEWVHLRYGEELPIAAAAERLGMTARCGQRMEVRLETAVHAILEKNPLTEVAEA